MEDLVRAIIILIGGTISFWFIAVAMKLAVSNPNQYQRNRENTSGFLKNLLGRNAVTIEGAPYTSHGLVCDVKSGKLIPNSAIASDDIDDILGN